MGKTHEALVFDFSALTGRDGEDIETELQALGVMVFAEEISAPYLTRMAARACTEEVGADAFSLMKLSDRNKIKGAARSFLMASA